MRPLRDCLGPVLARGGFAAPVGWGALILGLILFAGVAPLLTGRGAWADEALVAGAARPTALPDQGWNQVGDQVRAPGGPATAVEALTERVYGLEVKLRESAAARKAADQARMEAERRLAAGVQETDRLSAEGERLRDAKADLETRLARAEEQLAVAQAQGRRLTTETAALDQQLAQLKNEQQRLTEDFQGRLQAAEQSQASLRAQLLERDASLKALSALVPAPAGGALTLEAAQAQSADAAAALREALARAGAGGNAQARQALRAAEQRLHRYQFTAAQVAGARSVYQVRPGDTLVVIANHFYGDGSRWRAIKEANRRVLSDSKRLTPGLTLVIP